MSANSSLGAIGAVGGGGVGDKGTSSNTNNAVSNVLGSVLSNEIMKIDTNTTQKIDALEI